MVYTFSNFSVAVSNGSLGGSNTVYEHPYMYLVSYD